MFHKKKPINPPDPFNTTGAPRKDHTNYHGSTITDKESAMNEIARLERMKENYLKNGLKDEAQTISDRIKEIREAIIKNAQKKS